MKRIAVLVITVFLLIISMTGCVSDSGNIQYSVCDDVTMVMVADGSRFSIYVHKETRVMYIGDTGYNQGSLTVMIDEDGKPLLWEGEL